MTPYQPGKDVVVVPPKGWTELVFGALSPSKYEKRIGHVVKYQYWPLKRTMTYLVKFDDQLGQEELWFVENEIG